MDAVLFNGRYPNQQLFIQLLTRTQASRFDSNIAIGFYHRELKKVLERQSYGGRVNTNLDRIPISNTKHPHRLPIAPA